LKVFKSFFSAGFASQGVYNEDFLKVVLHRYLYNLRYTNLEVVSKHFSTSLMIEGEARSLPIGLLFYPHS
jgi:hypothetical protein